MIVAWSLAVPTFAVQAQQPPTLSIDAWLSAERGNPNLTRSLRAYEEAKYGPVTPIHQPRARTQQYVKADSSLAQEQAPVFDEQRIREFAAGASGRTGVYIVGHIGNAFVMDSDYVADVATLTASMEPLGLFTSGAVGVDLGRGLSTEIAVSHQSAGIDEVSLTRIGGFSGLNITESDVEGTMSALSLMGNVKLAFGSRDGILPYVMGGAGIARIAINDLKSNGTTILTDDSDIVFAYQAGAGVMLPLTERLSFDFGYRYFGTTDADLSDDGYPYSADSTSHTVLIGLKYGL